MKTDNIIEKEVTMDYPKKLNKKKFIDLLKEINYNNEIIERVNNLPEVVNKNDDEYVLNIIVNWLDKEDTYYEFEINYYCEDKIEFYLPYKIFNDIESTLNFVESKLEI